MLAGAYSSQYKNLERQHVDTIKTLAENEKSDAIARARKLSIETNKRRRALTIKRKAEAECEERRRKQILAKRREKQQEATEKFQRGHVLNRVGSSSSGERWSPHLGTAKDLEDALRIVRGSPASSRTSSAQTRDASSPSQNSSNHPYYIRQNSDPLSKPYFNKYAHQTINQPIKTKIKQEDLQNKNLHNLNISHSLFKHQLESFQQSLLEHQQKTLQEFNQQVMKEIGKEHTVVFSKEKDSTELENSASLSSVDSLDDSGSINTLRESCDLAKFSSKSNDNNRDGTYKVTETIKNKVARDMIKKSESSGPKNINSNHAQKQSMLPTQEKLNDEKQYNFLQRPKEMQQQLQEQQCELQQSLLEQQQKQKQLLQQQFNKQQAQLVKQQQVQHQCHLEQQSKTVTDTYDANENMRPKVHLKAWSTPSPHPPASPSIPITQTFVTHASPYSGKNTHTNTTLTNYEKVNTTSCNTHKSTLSSNENIKTNSNIVMSNEMQNNNQDVNGQYMSQFKVADSTNSVVSGHDKNLSFLETVMNGLSPSTQVTSENGSSVSNMAPISSVRSVAISPKLSVKPVKEPVVATKVVATAPARVTTKAPATVAALSETPLAKVQVNPRYYISSYGAAHLARQRTGCGTPNIQENIFVQNSNQPISVDNGNLMKLTSYSESLLQTDNQYLQIMIPDAKMNDDDTGDTDSVSTICEDKDAEAKEVRSILKNADIGKKGGILKKTGSSGSVKDIRDSLEITRVHLKTSAEDKEQQMFREQNPSKNCTKMPAKKNVHFADLHHDTEYYDAKDMCEERLFVKRDLSDLRSQKQARPVSAVTVKTINQNLSTKPPRATSATYRTSNIQSAKTQIVRPQATALVMTQNTQNVDSTVVSDLDKKMMIVNSNFMEKVPAMARANQLVPSVTSTSAYSSTNMNCHNSSPDKKVNYAVSSILMPITERSPHIYSSNKQNPVPLGCQNGPVYIENGKKHSSAIYDENDIHIDRTPTDEEINFLWDKLRNCLSYGSHMTAERNPNGQGSENQQASLRMTAPIAHTVIDGNTLGQFNSLNRVAQQQFSGYNTQTSTIRRQNSLDGATGSYQRRYGLLQQRKEQQNPNSLKSRQQPQQEYAVFQPPMPSNCQPQSAQVVLNGDEVTESLAGFLVAEQLSDQSVSESRIQKAIDEAQIRQHMHNAARPQAKVKSALSMEEQRLLESLDNLNNKLKEKEATIPNKMPMQQQPVLHGHQRLQSQQVTHLNGFTVHPPLSQRRVIEGASHRARLRITSAILKRKLQRQQ